MLQVTGDGTYTLCNGTTRRDFLEIGTLGAAGLSLPQLLAAKEDGAV